MFFIKKINIFGRIVVRILVRLLNTTYHNHKQHLWPILDAQLLIVNWLLGVAIPQHCPETLKENLIPAATNNSPPIRSETTKRT